MAPEYGATCGFFPVDADTIKFLRATGRAADRVALVEAYSKAQGMWREPGAQPVYTDVLELDLGTVEPSLAGPKRPQDRVPLANAKAGFAAALPEIVKTASLAQKVKVAGADYELGNGDVVIAAITSCTNTSNPSVLIAAGLVARNARAKGLKVKPWVKTSLAPGSQVVTDYLAKAGLQDDLDAMGFNLAGYGCTTCIGNSGPLPDPIADAVRGSDLVVAAVLSGNRNFEGRVNADVKANYLASPPLVVAYAIAGTLNKDLTTEPLGTGSDGQPVYLKDIWPSSAEIAGLIRTSVTPDMFAKRYGAVFQGDEKWQAMGKAKPSLTYTWNSGSTYVQNPPYFEEMPATPAPVADVLGARVLGLFQDSITTDHISPAGSIKKDGPAGTYLIEHQVRPAEFNSYGARRGNHNVMMRGTFANVRIKNAMMGGKEGGNTVHYPSGDAVSIYEAAMRYKAEGVPLVVLAGREYGTGSSRDWAAKGTKLLGVRAVIAQSFERIHRSNLVGMGVLPLVFADGQSWETLGLSGSETLTIRGLKDLKPRQKVAVEIARADGNTSTIEVLCRIDTEEEMAYYRNGGILPFVLRNLAAA
jgi:aconitate hydratase